MRIIAITGGPCAGKTSALSYLRDALELHGWKVAVIPECATALIGGGISPMTVGTVKFQTCVFALQIAQEDVFRQGVEWFDAPKSIVICDRGLMDGGSYITQEEFDTIISSHGLDRDKVLARYDAVYHLESAAKGLQSAYTLDTNATRMEDAEEAKLVDDRTVRVWEDHPHHVIIGNEARFEDKATHLINEVLAFLDL